MRREHLVIGLLTWIVLIAATSKSLAQDPKAQPAPAAAAAVPSPAPAAAPAAGAQAPPATPPASAPPPAAGQKAAAPPGAPEPPASESAMTTAGSISELEGFLEPFIYDVVNRRDPFQAFSEYVTPDSSPSRPLTPAQKFELDQLHLIGIMWDVKDPRAMFMDPDKEVLVLGRDEGIGNHNGYIASIREGEVVVVEAIHKRGDIIYKTKVLRIER